jgi:hypothetical protein
MTAVNVKVCVRRPRVSRATIIGPASANLHKSGRLSFWLSTIEKHHWRAALTMTLRLVIVSSLVALGAMPAADKLYLNCLSARELTPFRMVDYALYRRFEPANAPNR